MKKTTVDRIKKEYFDFVELTNGRYVFIKLIEIESFGIDGIGVVKAKKTVYKTHKIIVDYSELKRLIAVMIKNRVDILEDETDLEK